MEAVYLCVEIIRETCFGMPSNNIIGVSIGVRVTNKVEGVRLYNEPIFQLSLPFNGKTEYYMENVLDFHQFPIGLDVEQYFSVSYKLTPSDIDAFFNLLNQDENATIKAIVKTTNGDELESKPLKVSEITKYYEFVKDEPINELGL